MAFIGALGKLARVVRAARTLKSVVPKRYLGNLDWQGYTPTKSMPYKRRYASRSRRFKRFRRKRRRSRQRYIRYGRRLRKPGILFKGIVRVLRYHETADLSPSVGTGAHYRYDMGSIYKPNQSVALATGASHQPYGFDQLCPTLYKKFRVISSSITVRFVPTGGFSLDTHPYIVALRPRLHSGDTGPSARIDDDIENGGILWRVLKWPSASTNQTVLRYHCKPWKCHSVDLQDPDTWGDSTASPVKSNYVDVTAGPTQATVVYADVVIFVDMYFKVQFFEPNNDLAPS